MKPKPPQRVRPASDPVSRWRHRWLRLDQRINVGCGTLLGVVLGIRVVQAEQWQFGWLRSGLTIALVVVLAASIGALIGILVGRSLK